MTTRQDSRSVDELFRDALICHHQGRLAEAEAGYAAVLQAVPDHPDANNNLAILYRRQQRHDAALACYGRAVGRAADPAAVLSNRACLLLACERPDDAAADLRHALALRPDYAEAYFNLGDAHGRARRTAASRQAYERAIACRPGFGEPHANLACLLKSQDDLDGARRHFLEAIRVAPQVAPAYCNFGEMLKEQGLVAEAVDIFRRGLEADGSAVMMHSNLLFALNYIDGLTPDIVYRAHRHWGISHADPLWDRSRGFSNDRDPGRRLRIGYISPDFATHSVSFFIEPVLRHHDRQAVEIFCYAYERVVDFTTEKLRGHADHWIPIQDMSDAAIAERIAADGIDILVDLAGHTADHRLLVLARKPAPIQVTWLGYPNTTGMAAVDYRLTDTVAQPADGPQTPSSEVAMALPGGFHTYQPPFFAPECAPLPALDNGFVTFGSFNNIAKVTPAVVRVWSRVLAAVPTARMIVKSKVLSDAATRHRLQTLFAAYGVAAERVDLLGRIEPAGNHLAAYGRIDIALDPFPYNGTTTTCEALWMGVPVVTLAGNCHAARVGASLLTQVGLTGHIAVDEADYVAKAAALAGDIPALAALRDGMRSRLQASALLDHAGFTRTLERAYRLMWQRWLAR